MTQIAAASNSLYKWVDERLGLTEIIAFASHKTVPAHKHSFWYYWGGISLFLFLEPFHLRHHGAYVLGLPHEGLSQAARVWMVQRVSAPRHRYRLRLQRLPAAHGRPQLLRY